MVQPEERRSVLEPLNCTQRIDIARKQLDPRVVDGGVAEEDGRVELGRFAPHATAAQRSALLVAMAAGEQGMFGVFRGYIQGI